MTTSFVGLVDRIQPHNRVRKCAENYNKIDTTSFFSQTSISIWVISSRDSFRVLFEKKLLRYVSFEKNVLIF